MPAVADFRRANPKVDIHIVASQALAPGIAADADLAVLFGERDDFAGAFSGDRHLLIPERATAVCAPGFRPRFGPFERIDQLLDLPLVPPDTARGSRWFPWPGWFLQALGRAAW